jgi:Domain of unknown function (DUF4157)
MSDSITTATPETKNAAPMAHPPVRENQMEAEVDRSQDVGQRVMRSIGGGSPEAPPEKFTGALDGGSGGLWRQMQRGYGNQYVGQVIQRKCDDCEKKEEKIQRKGDGDLSTVPEGFEAAMQQSGSGQQLDDGTRSFMESRFGQDFGDVKVHTDSSAAEASQQIQAQAFTTRRDIYFGRGRYQPQATEGKKLLAHELTHVLQQRETLQFKRSIGLPDDIYEQEANDVSEQITRDLPTQTATLQQDRSSSPEQQTITLQQDHGTSAHIRRQPGGASPSSSGSTSTTATRQGYRVEIMTADEYLAATGHTLDTLPEKRLVSPDEAGFGDQSNPPLWQAGVGSALVLPARPSIPLPQNTTGLLWSGGHAADFAVVEGKLVVRGFRAELWRHGLSDLERSWLGRLLFGRGGGPATQSLNRGVPGFWANDWLFPYFADATAVYPNKVLTPKEAAAFAEFLKSRGSEYTGKTYRYSPPEPGHPAWTKAFGETPPGFCPPGAVNCINLSLEEHQRALGGVNFEPGQPGPKTGKASAIGPWLEEPPPGVTTVRIGPAMRAQAAAGVIKVGGVILLVYGAAKSYQRIQKSSPEELPTVVGEETGSWVGGWIGSVLTEALGGALICSETGLGAFFCALGFGIVGGLGGSVLGHGIGHGIGHDVGEGIKLLGDTPRLIETSVLMFGSDEDRRNYYELRELETGEPNPFYIP